MFSLACVILPFSGVSPEVVIQASLARFQRGGQGKVPDEWITFQDETAELQCALEAKFIFTRRESGGLQIGGDSEHDWYIDGDKIQSEMQMRGIEKWHVRFAEVMDLDTFFDRFGSRLVRHPDTGAYGLWLNPFGHWDWWDLGGCFDGRIMRDRSMVDGRKVSKISSGPSRGRRNLSNLEDRLREAREALDQHPVAEIDVQNDRNIEVALTVLEDIQADPEHACPGALVLPPGSFKDHLRWLGTLPELGPVEAFTELGLASTVSWPEVVEAVPAVLPIVLYTGKADWTAPLEVGQLIAPSPLSNVQPDQRYYVVAARSYTDDARHAGTGLPAVWFRLLCAADRKKMAEVK
jgi:hypothetical protein